MVWYVFNEQGKFSLRELNIQLDSDYCKILYCNYTKYIAVLKKCYNAPANGLTVKKWNSIISATTMN